MSKVILYINNQYLQDFEQLKDFVANPKLIKDDLFRRELLSAYRDGVLEKWFEERGRSLMVSPLSIRDDDVFIALYKEIVNESECPNFRSDFSKLGELLRCEISGKAYPINNGEIVIDTENADITIKFVFRSFKADNNIRHFSVKNNDVIVQNIDCSWNDKTKGKEHFFEVTINPSIYEGVSLSLVEGKDNRLCKLFCKFPEFKEIDINGEILKFYYVTSMKCWIVRLPHKAQFKTLDTYTKKNKSFNFKLLSTNDIERLKKDTKIWSKLKKGNFWICNGQYHDSSIDRIQNVSSWNKNIERHQCWLKLKEIPLQ